MLDCLACLQMRKQTISIKLLYSKSNDNYFSGTVIQFPRAFILFCLSLKVIQDKLRFAVQQAHT